MVNIENIDPYMLYKKITEYPMPDKDSKEYIKSHTHFFVNL